MAKKRKAAAKKAAKTPVKSKSKRPLAVQATPAQLGKPAPHRKHSSEDNVTALVIAVAIVIFLASLYLYQQNVKPKASQLAPVPAITLVSTV